MAEHGDGGRAFPPPPQIDPDRFEVATALELAPYTFASTMPETPHYYSHRRRFVDQDLFGRVVKQVRYRTEKRRYIHGRSGNRYWTDYWSANGYQYWVVDSDAPGCPDSQIGVMNRDFRRYPDVAVYDRWAPTYDQSFVGRHNVQETCWWMRRMSMPREGQRLLDVGCGTGMLVDYRHRSLPPERYVGIDPSEAMLARFASKHPGFATRPRRNLLRTIWQDYVPVDWDRTLRFDGAAGP